MGTTGTAPIVSPPTGARIVFKSSTQDNVTSPSLAILPGWVNAGGVTYLELANHSVQGRNDFDFGDATTTEKSLAAAQASGLKVTPGDGLKYGRLNLKSRASGTVIVGVDLDLTIDTIGPTLTFCYDPPNPGVSRPRLLRAA